MNKTPKDMGFDEHVKNKYANHEIIPPDNLWESINHKAAQLENAHLKKRVIFYKRLSFGMLILLLGLSSLYLFKKNKGNNLIEMNKVALIEEPSTNIIRDIGNKHQIANLNKVIQEPSTLPNQKIIPLSLATKEIPEITASTTIPDKREEQNNIIDNTKDELLVVEDTYLINKGNNSTEQTFTNSSLSNTTKTEKLVDKSDVNTNLNKTLSLTKKKQEQSFTINQKAEKNNNTTDNSDIVATNLDEQINLQDSVSDSFLTKSNGGITTKNTDVSPIIPAKTLSRITVMALFSPTYSYRSITGDNAAFYNKHQTGKMVYNAEVNVGYNISDNLILRLGVNYNKLNQEVELKNKRPNDLPVLMDPNNKKIIIFSSLGTIEANDLSEFEFAGDDEDDYLLDDESDFASLNFKEEQKFSFLNIPLTIAYELGKKKIKLIAQIGIVSSFTIRNDSKITIGNVNTSQDIIEVKDYHEIKSFSFGSTASIGAKYNITKRLAILFLLTYNYSFTNLNKNKNNILKPYSMNFSTGLQYNF